MTEPQDPKYTSTSASRPEWRERFERDLRSGNLGALGDYLQNLPEAARASACEELLAQYVAFNQDRNQTLDPAFIESAGEHARQAVDRLLQKGAVPEAHQVPDTRSELGHRSALQDTTDEWVREKSSEVRPGSRLGRYAIADVLGQGGMGSVFRAFDTVLKRDVALKIPRFGKNQTDQFISRFYREAIAMAALNHPNLCQVYDVGSIDDLHYLTMEFLPGQSMQKRIKQQQPSLVDSVRLVRKIAMGLYAAHQKDVIHRDLKPDNIMMVTSGEPVVIDFGLARPLKLPEGNLTSTGLVVGTPAFMSPEQARGEDSLDCTSDIFSLGIIFYRLICGQMPFEGLMQIASHSHPTKVTKPSQINAEVSRELDEICLTALAARPDDRFDSMLEFANALDSVSPVTDSIADKLQIQRRSRRTKSPGYDLDLFVGFAPTDDEPKPGETSGWVSELVKDLTWRLCQLNGSKEEISIAVAHDLIHEIESPNHARFKKSAQILLVNSPGFQNGIWNREQFKGFSDFCAERSQQGQVVIVDRDECSPLSGIQGARPLRFWKRESQFGFQIMDGKLGDEAGRLEYYSRLDDLARTIFRGFERLSNVYDQADSPNDNNQPDLERHVAPTVYLAEVTDDLDSQREQLCRFLEARGVHVIPADWLPRDLNEVREQVTELMGKADLFVQLLGPHPGRMPVGSQQSYANIQFQIAVDQGRAIMQWRDRNLHLDEVNSAEHQSLLTGNHVRSLTLAEFKNEIAGWLQQYQNRAPRESRNSEAGTKPFVFVNAAQADAQIAAQVVQELDRKEFPYVMPLTSGTPEETFEDLQANLMDCDGLCLVYGEVPGQWIREQLRILRRQMHRRERPLHFLSLLDAPPQEKPEIGMKLPRMQVINCREGLTPEQISEFIARLEKV